VCPRCEYLFNFNNTFEIHDDIEVLKRMGMAYGLEKGQCTRHDLSRAVKMVPRSLEPYVTRKLLTEGHTQHYMYAVGLGAYLHTQHVTCIWGGNDVHLEDLLVSWLQ